MDGTARGGVVLALAEKLRVPLRYLGVGEGVDDLQEFDAKNFLKALLS
jgi:fused signal recognition particle receptor